MAQQQLEKTKTAADAIASLTPMRRAEELLREMTVEEKAIYEPGELVAIGYTGGREQARTRASIGDRASAPRCPGRSE